MSKPRQVLSQLTMHIMEELQEDILVLPEIVSKITMHGEV